MKADQNINNSHNSRNFQCPEDDRNSPIPELKLSMKVKTKTLISSKANLLDQQNLQFLEDFQETKKNDKSEKQQKVSRFPPNIFPENQLEYSSISFHSQNLNEKRKTNSGIRDLKNILDFLNENSLHDHIKYLPVQNLPHTQEILKIQSIQQGNKKQFCFQPIQRGKKLSTTILRAKNGFTYLFPRFDMQFADDCKHIVSCQKILGFHSTFCFSIQKDNFEEDHESFCGKLRGNLLGSAYNIFGSEEREIGNVKIKNILCSAYFTSTEESFQPKLYEVYVLQEGVSFWDLEGIEEEEVGLGNLIKIGANNKKIQYFRARKPEYCLSTGQFMLNFSGRVPKGSVKNFILEDPKSGREVLMFGKSEDHIFNMDISSPLSPYLGLGLALPFFSFKFYC